MASKTRRRSGEVGMLEQAVMDRLAAEPASFQDLIDEGLLDRSTASVILRRLKRRKVLRVFGYRQATTKRGHPRTLYALAPPSGPDPEVPAAISSEV